MLFGLAMWQWSFLILIGLVLYPLLIMAVSKWLAMNGERYRSPKRNNEDDE